MQVEQDSNTIYPDLEENAKTGQYVGDYSGGELTIAELKQVFR